MSARFVVIPKGNDEASPSSFAHRQWYRRNPDEAIENATTLTKRKWSSRVLRNTAIVVSQSLTEQSSDEEARN
jgi:hypothetical protein